MDRQHMPTSKKHAEYLQGAKDRLADTRTKLANIYSRMDAASEQLNKAVSQAEHHMAIVESIYEQMTSNDDDISEESRLAFDRSWDDVALSIKNVVSRLA